MFSQTMIIGHLGQAPDLRHTPNGDAVATLSVATNKRWKDRNTGKEMEHTEWHRVNVWGRQAENAAQYLRKGSLVGVVGETQTRKYTDKNGIERWATEIRAQRVMFLDRQGAGAAPPHPAEQAAAQSREMNHPSEESMPDFDSFDDDLPF